MKLIPDIFIFSVIGSVTGAYLSSDLWLNLFLVVGSACLLILFQFILYVFKKWIWKNLNDRNIKRERSKTSAS